MSILSIDIGGTSIKYALMGKDAVILSRGKIPTPQEGRSLSETVKHPKRYKFNEQC